MNNREEILNELKMMAPALIPLKVKEVFHVPAGYFNEFPVRLVSFINLDEAHLLPVKPGNVMSVPEGYFESFADNLLLKIKSPSLSAEEELRELSPALSVTGNDNIFTVPPRYFQDLPGIIISRVNKPVRVVTMQSRSSFARYAAAAVITALMGLSLFSVFNKKNAIPATSFIAAIEDGQQILKSNSFNAVLESIPYEDIVGYLQENGQDVKTALLAASIDTKELPSADAYITNENTLDNYLNELNLNDYSN
ncbi:MAG: hypothetical protein ABIP80_04535 [Ferruginibacter sp.]